MKNRTAFGLSAGIISLFVGAAVAVGLSPAKPAHKPLKHVVSQTINDDGSIQTVTQPDDYVAPTEPVTPPLDPVTDQTITVPPATDDGSSDSTPPSTDPPVVPNTTSATTTTEVPIEWGGDGSDN